MFWLLLGTVNGWTDVGKRRRSYGHLRLYWAPCGVSPKFEPSGVDDRLNFELSFIHPISLVISFDFLLIQLTCHYYSWLNCCCKLGAEGRGLQQSCI
jgi:hypothetical protein